MITYVSSKDAQLFEIAKQALLDNHIEIDGELDLPKYLNMLAQLKLISPRFVRLPLYEDGHEDEEIFEINANERAIKVPASFSKNGVGVVSDELAETVWFRINRYFDIKDFGQATLTVGDELKDGNLHILIQWEAPDGAKGASWAYAVDVDTDPDFVYFGWALTAEHLTAQAGNIKFAVRILEYDGDEIAYSFSTQAAQVAVKPGLSFDLTDENVEVHFEDVADKIAHRIMDGQIAHCPILSTDLNGVLANLTNGTAELSVVAAAPQGETYDAMAYKWYHKADGENEVFHLVNPEQEGQFTPALTVTESGEYYVVVFGMLEIVDSEEIIFEDGEPSEDPVKFKYHTSIASTKSTVCKIPAPVKIEFKENGNLPEVIMLAEGAVLNLAVDRQRIDGNIVGDVTLRVEKTASVAKIGEDEVIPDSDFSVVDLTAADCPIVVTVNGDDITVALSKEIPAEEEGDPTTVLAAEGYYRVIVINTLNGNFKETPEEGEAHAICRVVKPAVAPTSVSTQLIDRNGNNITELQPSVSRGEGLKAIFTTPAVSDKLTIQWYRMVGHIGEGAGNDPDVALNNATEFEYVPMTTGTYYFILTNQVEETFASVTSDPVTFSD